MSLRQIVGSKKKEQELTDLVYELWQIQKTLKELEVDKLIERSMKIKKIIKETIPDGTYFLSNGLVLKVATTEYKEYVVPAGKRTTVSVTDIHHQDKFCS